MLMDFRILTLKRGTIVQFDLFSEPYGFDKDVLFRIDDGKMSNPQKEICLWSKNQIFQPIRRRRR
jgi:hypothetical protein